MKRALLIDDEPETCQLLCNMLNRVGAECVFAHSLAHGRMVLVGAHFDLVFMDVHLPDGLGYALMPDIRAYHPDARTIAISALHTEGAHALDAGVDLFVPKPFDRATIYSSIRALGLRSWIEAH